MTTSPISTVAMLQDYLHHAMLLEHATFPPYLTTLYSIHPGTNREAIEAIRVVLVEEMLHLTLAANLLNAIGGSPAIGKQGFMPPYPAYLPDGEKDFKVNLAAFAPSTVENFLQIERPSLAPSPDHAQVPKRRDSAGRMGINPHDDSMDFYSIGDFYMAIEAGFEQLYAEMGDALFSGDPARQVSGEYFYSGGGECFPVVDMPSAKRAIELIVGQGEGAPGGIFDDEGEMAHYYRFEQLTLGRYYRPGDEPHKPTGPELPVEWDAVFPICTNPRLSDYAADPELQERAKGFNQHYAKLLQVLGETFNGAPEKLLEAVPMMFHLRSETGVLMRNPVSGTTAKEHSAASHLVGPAHAAPTFEVDAFLPTANPD